MSGERIRGLSVLTLTAVLSSACTWKATSDAPAPTAPPASATQQPPSLVRPDETPPPPVQTPLSAPTCRVSAQQCGCGVSDPTSGGGAAGGAAGGISWCEQQALECTQAKLVSLEREALESSNRCAPNQLHRVTFDSLPPGSDLPLGFFDDLGITLTTRPDCPPRVEDAAPGSGGRRALVTCGAALGDVTLTLRSALAVALTFDRGSDPAGSQRQYLLRVYDGERPYLRGSVRAEDVPRRVGEYAFETTFEPGAARAYLGLTSVFIEHVTRVQLGVAGACDGSSTLPPEPIRIEEIAFCGKLAD